MAGLADELLAAVLRYAQDRLEDLRDQALGELEPFLQALGVPAAPLTPAQADEVRGHLTAARAALETLPGHVADLRILQALDAVATVLSRTQAALDVVTAAVPGARDLTALLRGVLPAGPTSGLARQLGLPSVAPEGLSVTGGAVVLTLPAGAGTTLREGPATLTIGSSELTVRLRIDGGTPRLAVTFAARRTEIGVAGAAVSTLLGGAGAGVVADLVIGVDTDHGLTAGGGVAKRVTLPPIPSPTRAVDVRGIGLEVPDPADAARAAAANAVDLLASLAGSLAGGVDYVLDGAGVRLVVDPARLRAGESPIRPEVRPPSGIGLAIDAGPVSGGGYLTHRTRGDVEEFGGALELSLGPIGVSAIGLLTLGGETGFSLVVLMSVRFTPPIDLTFGFTLNAVGGLLGIQRVLDTDALRGQLRNHAIDHLLFPEDPVAAAPAILETLGTVFPARSGGFVIGPMIQIGWGRPISFVTASVGLVLSFPDPTVVILGQLRVRLPAPELPIVDIKADLYGEFSSERVLVLVMLSDSRIALFAVEGDIGILLRFGSDPEFAISAGGFHPRFTPPHELAGMRRIAIDLSPPALLRLRAEAYFALTSNSLQLGCRVELSAEIGPVGAHGFLQFDALVRFSPFSFEIDLGAGVSIRFAGMTIAGIELHLHLSGPAPWRAHGTATFEILWWEIDVEVGPLEWGDGANPPPEPVHARRVACAALSERGAWVASLPRGGDRLVALRDDPADATLLLVHPLGQLAVSQSAVPLQTRIVRIGANPVPPEEQEVRLGVPQVNGVDASAFSRVDELFSAGQYLDLTDDQRLSRPAFEPMPAGMQINAPGGALFGAGEEAQLMYETFRTDLEPGLPRLRGEAWWASGTHALVVGATATGRSALREADRYRVDPDPLTLADPALGVVTGTGSLVAAAADALTYTHAAQALGAGQQVVRLGVEVAVP